MRLLTGTRLGQSGGELAAAVSFSLVIHVIVLVGAIILSLQAKPRIAVPPFYRVNLVALPPGAQELPLTAAAPPAAEPVPPAPKPEATKHPAKTRHAARTAPKPAATRTAMPDLEAKETQKQLTGEEAAPSGAKPQEAVSVAVSGAPQDFPFLPYVAIVRDKVERNWNPPPGAKGATVKVLFTVLRSGRVGEAKLTSSSGNFYFDQAAMRAILASSPFPPLPEGFFRDHETFSVDLMERE